jgi:hypothetical protein
MALSCFYGGISAFYGELKFADNQLFKLFLKRKTGFLWGNSGVLWGIEIRLVAVSL